MNAVERLKKLKDDCEREQGLRRDSIISIYDVADVMQVNPRTVYSRAVEAKIDLFKLNCPERNNRMTSYMRVEDAEKIIKGYYAPIPK